MKSSFFVLLPLLISAVCNWRSVGADSSPTGASTIGSAAPPPSAPAPRSAAELEKLAQPIALHPDPLIAIILPAAVYPLEIVQAARFIKDTNNIPKVDEQPWDNNVKQLAKYPEMIARMDADLSWTIDLGQAFLDQPKELMDTIQGLRSKAQKAGTLRTTPQQIVTVTNIVVIQTNVTQVTSVTREIVQVQPANPEIIYVPSYPTTVYYPHLITCIIHTRHWSRSASEWLGEPSSLTTAIGVMATSTLMSISTETQILTGTATVFPSAPAIGEPATEGPVRATRNHGNRIRTGCEPAGLRPPQGKREVGDPELAKAGRQTSARDHRPVVLGRDLRQGIWGRVHRQELAAVDSQRGVLAIDPRQELVDLGPRPEPHPQAGRVSRQARIGRQRAHSAA